MTGCSFKFMYMLLGDTKKYTRIKKYFMVNKKVLQPVSRSVEGHVNPLFCGVGVKRLQGQTDRQTDRQTVFL